MTDDQIRIAIAEWCGWTFQPMTGPLGCPWVMPSATKWEDRMPQPPDYPNDLNAVHEVENIINSNTDLGYAYDMALCKLVNAYEEGLCNHVRLYHATARQRCEALLKTVGLWKE
jgi:hypothetical protein